MRRRKRRELVRWVRWVYRFCWILSIRKGFPVYYLFIYFLLTGNFLARMHAKIQGDESGTNFSSILVLKAPVIRENSFHSEKIPNILDTRWFLVFRGRRPCRSKTGTSIFKMYLLCLGFPGIGFPWRRVLWQCSWQILLDHRRDYSREEMIALRDNPRRGRFHKKSVPPGSISNVRCFFSIDCNRFEVYSLSYLVKTLNIEPYIAAKAVCEPPQVALWLGGISRVRSARVRPALVCIAHEEANEEEWRRNESQSIDNRLL